MNTNATLTDMLGVLALANLEKPLIFKTSEGPIGGGYHVTELKHLAINSIDCGGRTTVWNECHLQLLDGTFGTHMSVAKFVKIADSSVTALPALAEGPIFIEYAPGNQGLRQYRIATIATSGPEVSVYLKEARAGCKPAMGWKATDRTGPHTSDASGCCGSSASTEGRTSQAQACCG